MAQVATAARSGRVAGTQSWARSTSDLEDGHVSLLAGEKAQVAGIMCCDDAAPETDCGGHGESVDGQLASGAGAREEVACDPGDPGPGGDHLREASAEQCVDGLAGTAPSVQFDKYR